MRGYSADPRCFFVVGKAMQMRSFVWGGRVVREYHQRLPGKTHLHAQLPRLRTDPSTGEQNDTQIESPVTRSRKIGASGSARRTGPLYIRTRLSCAIYISPKYFNGNHTYPECAPCPKAVICAVLPPKSQPDQVMSTKGVI